MVAEELSPLRLDERVVVAAPIDKSDQRRQQRGMWLIALRPEGSPHIHPDTQVDVHLEPIRKRRLGVIHGAAQC
jgi:hypothetical protein